jgi:hypothetical protein
VMAISMGEGGGSYMGWRVFLQVRMQLDQVKCVFWCAENGKFAERRVEVTS